MSDELAVFGGEKTVTAEVPIWPRFSDEDIDAATWALNEARTKRDFISASFGGEGLEAFEADFAEFLGADHVVSVNSGCAAIHVALMAAGVKGGDEVIVRDELFRMSLEQTGFSVALIFYQHRNGFADKVFSKFLGFFVSQIS